MRAIVSRRWRIPRRRTRKAGTQPVCADRLTACPAACRITSRPLPRGLDIECEYGIRSLWFAISGLIQSQSTTAITATGATTIAAAVTPSHLMTLSIDSATKSHRPTLVRCRRQRCAAATNHRLIVRYMPIYSRRGSLYQSRIAAGEWLLSAYLLQEAGRNRARFGIVLDDAFTSQKPTYRRR